MCCQVEVSATSWSLVQRSPTDCDASLWSRNLVNVEALAHWGLLRQKQTKKQTNPTLQTSWLQCILDGNWTHERRHVRSKRPERLTQPRGVVLVPVQHTAVKTFKANVHFSVHMRFRLITDRPRKSACWPLKRKVASISFFLDRTLLSPSRPLWLVIARKDNLLVAAVLHNLRTATCELPSLQSTRITYLPLCYAMNSHSLRLTPISC